MGVFGVRFCPLGRRVRFKLGVKVEVLGGVCIGCSRGSGDVGLGIKGKGVFSGCMSDRLPVRLLRSVPIVSVLADVRYKTTFHFDRDPMEMFSGKGWKYPWSLVERWLGVW